MNTDNDWDSVTKMNLISKIIESELKKRKEKKSKRDIVFYTVQRTMELIKKDVVFIKCPELGNNVVVAELLSKEELSEMIDKGEITKG